jgi:hypothetical protein
MNTLGPSLGQDVSVLARVQGSLAKPRRHGCPGPTLCAERNLLRGELGVLDLSGHGPDRGSSQSREALHDRALLGDVEESRVPGHFQLGRFTSPTNSQQG